MKAIKILLVFMISIILVSSIASAFWPVDWFKSRYFSSDKPPQFSITSPIDNSVLQEGSSLTIKWKKINFPGKEAIGISISRLDAQGNDVYSTGIARDLKSNSFRWKIPEGLNGTFRIEVYTQGIGIKISDSVLVNINGYKEAPRLDYLTPNSGSLKPSVNTGISNTNELNELIINGNGFSEKDAEGPNKVFIVFDNVRFGAEVFNKSNPYLYGVLSDNGKNLKISPANTFSEEDVKPGTYELYVVNLYGKSNSLNLTIEEPRTPAITKILAPENGDVWRRGQTYSIKWESRQLSSVIISLKNLIPVYTDCGPSINTPGNEDRPIPQQPTGEKCAHYEAISIFTDTPDDDIENWEIPTSTATGNYSIIVYNYENHVTKEMDGSFRII